MRKGSFFLSFLCPSISAVARLKDNSPLPAGVIIRNAASATAVGAGQTTNTAANVTGAAIGGGAKYLLLLPVLLLLPIQLLKAKQLTVL